ncbi:MAG: cell wall hydrolase [Bacillota bacterium]
MKKTMKMGVIVCLIIILLLSSAISVSANTTYYTTLKFGSRGTEVVKLQSALISQGYLYSSADGIYGKLTENAVIKFQIAKKLRIDGIAGKQTQTALYGGTSSATASRSTSTYETDLYWLSRIIHAEAEAEPYKGKVAVGNVVLNRVNSSLFPNTVKGVIFDDYKGIPQFSPVADGTIYKSPSIDSINAAKDALNGVRPVGAATYFFNPAKSAGTWIVNNKTYVGRIGNHVFYK